MILWCVRSKKTKYWGRAICICIQKHYATQIESNKKKRQNTAKINHIYSGQIWPYNLNCLRFRFKFVIMLRARRVFSTFLHVMNMWRCGIGYVLEYMYNIHHTYGYSILKWQASRPSDTMAGLSAAMVEKQSDTTLDVSKCAIYLITEFCSSQPTASLSSCRAGTGLVDNRGVEPLAIPYITQRIAALERQTLSRKDTKQSYTTLRHAPEWKNPTMGLSDWPFVTVMQTQYTRHQQHQQISTYPVILYVCMVQTGIRVNERTNVRDAGQIKCISRIDFSIRRWTDEQKPARARSFHNECILSPIHTDITCPDYYY